MKFEASVLRGVHNRELTSDAESYESMDNLNKATRSSLVIFLGNVLAQVIVR